MDASLELYTFIVIHSPVQTIDCTSGTLYCPSLTSTSVRPTVAGSTPMTKSCLTMYVVLYTLPCTSATANSSVVEKM